MVVNASTPPLWKRTAAVDPLFASLNDAQCQAVRHVDGPMLVLAGPGSGKTRVIAHRCAYLLRVERVRPREILVVCFNRSAAINLRQRIRDLVGKDASYVTVQTFHGLAMRLIGASFASRLEDRGEEFDFDALIPEATKMLRGECDIPGMEPDEMRERLLAGYRYILIDEYQDLNKVEQQALQLLACGMEACPR